MTPYSQVIAALLGTPKRCAGCGVKVERGRNGHWALRSAASPSVLVFTCRTKWAGPGVMVSADYHYVEGEEQRHFKAES